MGLWSDIMSGNFHSAGLLDGGAYDVQQAQTRSVITSDSPMQAVLDGLRGTQATGALSLDMIVDKAQAMNVSPLDMANMSGLDLSQVNFTQTGVDRLRALANDSTLSINVRGADISGSVFHPASTFEGLIIDEMTVGTSTSAQHVTFDGFDHSTNLDLPRGDWSYFEIAGADSATAAAHANITIGANATAVGGDISGSRYTSLNATQADLSGLDASGARVLAVNVQGGRLNGSDFSNSSFALGSRLNADLIGANFENAALGDLDLSGARLVGANMQGADVTAVNFNQAILREQDLHGATYRDGAGAVVEINADNVGAFIANRAESGQVIDVQPADVSIRTQIANDVVQGPADDVVARIGRMGQSIARTRAAGFTGESEEAALPAQSNDVQMAAATPEKDGLITALYDVNAAMASGAIRCDASLSDASLSQEVSVLDEYQTAACQRERDVPERTI